MLFSTVSDLGAPTPESQAVVVVFTDTRAKIQPTPRTRVVLHLYSLSRSPPLPASSLFFASCTKTFVLLWDVFRCDISSTNMPKLLPLSRGLTTHLWRERAEYYFHSANSEFQGMSWFATHRDYHAPTHPSSSCRSWKTAPAALTWERALAWFELNPPLGSLLSTVNCSSHAEWRTAC